MKDKLEQTADNWMMACCHRLLDLLCVEDHHARVAWLRRRGQVPKPAGQSHRVLEKKVKLTLAVTLSLPEYFAIASFPVLAACSVRDVKLTPLI
eukprot:2179224-Rhodomonas_salina.3